MPRKYRNLAATDKVKKKGSSLDLEIFDYNENECCVEFEEEISIVNLTRPKGREIRQKLKTLHPSARKIISQLLNNVK